MFLFFPVGHEAKIKKFPIVTVGIIILTVFIYGITSVSIRNYQQKLLQRIKQASQVERQLFLIEGRNNLGTIQYSNQSMTLAALQEAEGIESPLYQRREAIKRGEIISYLSPVYQEWRKIYEKLLQLIAEIKALKIRSVFHCFGFVPNNFSFHHMLTYIFLHGGLFHLLSNMFYLWLLGCNIEDAWGRRNFLIFYFGSGIAAALMHKIMHPESGIPCVGASGAIAGVMGAFMIRNYRVRIRFLFLLFFPFLHTTFFQIPAGIVLFFWFLQQLLYALVTHHTVAGVAFWAHIGGFVLGATVGSILKFGKLEEKYIKPEILKEEARLYENPEILQAQKLLESGRYQEAEEILRKLLSREPQHIEARSVLVNIYLWGKAPIDQIRREINLLFKNYIEKNAKTTALLKYSELVKQLPNLVLSPEVHFFVARAAEEAGNNNLALSLYNGLIATYPNAPQTWKAFFNKGLVLEKLSRLNEAIKVFEELLTRYPEHEWRGLVEDKIKELKAQF